MLFAMIFAVSIYSPNLAPFASWRKVIRLLSAIDRFLFVDVSRQTKRFSLCALCVSAVKNLSAVVGVSLRLSGNLNGLKADG